MVKDTVTVPIAMCPAGRPFTQVLPRFQRHGEVLLVEATILVCVSRNQNEALLFVDVIQGSRRDGDRVRIPKTIAITVLLRRRWHVAS